MIASCYLLIYSNLELFLEKKIKKNDSLCIVGTRKELFFGADNCLYYAMLSYINVLGIEGPNYLVFYKIKQACDLFSCLPTLTTLILLILFHY